MRGLLLPIVLTLFAAACAGGSEGDSGPTSDGSSSIVSDGSSSIVIAYTGAIDSLDPQHSDFGQTSLVDSAFYDGLVTYTPDNELVGALATNFELAPTADSVSITLRSDATFHDGEHITSDDVAYSLDRYVRLGSGIGGLISDYESTTVIDETHLTINLKRPNSIFLSLLSRAYVLNSKLITANAGSDDGQSWLADHDAGSGPYVLADANSTGGNIVAERFEEYWGFDAKRPSSIVMRRIDQSSTQLAELESSGINYANNLSAADAKSASGANLTSVDIPVIQQLYVYFNTTTGPTADVELRRALQLAFDYEGALASILGGSGEIAQGPAPLGMPCEPEFPAYSQDLDRARSMLAEAGYSDLTLTLRYQPEIVEQSQMAQLFQSDLGKIGVTLNLEPITFSDYLNTLSSDDTIPQMMLLADESKVPNVGAFLSQFYGPNSAGQNRSGLMDPEVHALIVEATSTSDSEVQCAAYVEAQRIIYDKATAVNLFSKPWPLGYTTNLTGVVVSPIVTPISLATLRLK